MENSYSGNVFLESAILVGRFLGVDKLVSRSGEPHRVKKRKSEGPATAIFLTAFSAFSNLADL